jgi:acetylornithine deacetylase
LNLAVVGIVPGMSMDSVLEDVTKTVADNLKDIPEASFTVKQVPDSLFVCGTEAVPELEEPNISLTKAYGQILGDKPIFNRKNAFNDTIRFREAGINAVTFGSGEDGWAPINESISIPKSVAATKIFALTIMHLLGVAESGSE